MCHCADCQAFARFLGREDEILDAAGGTDVVQMAQKNVTLIEGRETLACIRLSEHGLCRWYARCCNTPIGNTHRNFRIAVVGLIHNCLRPGAGSLDDAIGPARMRVFVAAARGTPKPRATGLAGGAARIAGIVLVNLITGGYCRTPFFEPASGAPVVPPRVLDPAERSRL